MRLLTRSALTSGTLAIAGEAQFGHVVELADVPGHLEERVEARALPRAEAVAELLEVAREEACGVAVARTRLVGEPLGLGAGEAYGCDECVLEIGEPVDDGLRRRPHGEHHRQPGALEPEPAEVVVRRRILEGALQRGVADEQRGVGLFLEGEDLGVREQHPREHDGGGALGRDGDRPHATEGHAAHELDRVDGSLGRDAQPRQESKRSAFRAYSIDEIGAMSSWPSSSIRFSSVGTPATSSTSYSSRWKTGAMLT